MSNYIHLFLCLHKASDLAILIALYHPSILFINAIFTFYSLSMKKSLSVITDLSQLFSISVLFGYTKFGFQLPAQVFKKYKSAVFSAMFRIINYVSHLDQLSVFDILPPSSLVSYENEAYEICLCVCQYSPNTFFNLLTKFIQFCNLHGITFARLS